MSSNATTGGKIGPRVAQLVAEAAMNTRIAMGPHMSRIAVDAMNKFMDGIGAEAQGTSGELWGDLADTGLLPPWAGRTVDFARRGRGEWSALLNHAAIGAGVGNSVVTLINNALAPAVNQLIRAAPNGLLTPETAAQAVARAQVDFGAAATEAAMQGIDRPRFTQLVNLNRYTPAVADGLEMLRRGIISTDVIPAIFRDQAVDEHWWTRLIALARTELSPQELAALVTFGVLSEADATPAATRSGMTKADFRMLVAGNGQPPSTTDLLAAHRRGIIDDARLERGITQGPVRNEWFPMIKALSLGPPTADAALNAATQNLLPVDQAKRIVADAGIDPKYFPWLLETYGRPLGISDAAELFNRGELSHAETRQMFLESNIKNKYVDLVFKLFERIPPMDNVRTAYRDGAIDRAEALRRLRQLGFSLDDAGMLLDQAAAQKHEANRNLSESVLREMYLDGAIDAATATEGLATLGYDEKEAAWLLAIDDLRRARRAREAAISRVHSRYVAHRLDQTSTITALDQLGVPSDQREMLMDLWEIERESTVSRLTTAQITAALKRELIPRSDALNRLRQAGYSAGDAAIIVELAVPAA